MRLLLDTHALIWFVSSPGRLSSPARAAIAAPANMVFVSPCSGYEIAYKQEQGRLPPLPLAVADLVRRAQFFPLPITIEHAETAARLPRLHRDPWDRLLIAQALREKLTIVTIDRIFALYGVSVLW